MTPTPSPDTVEPTQPDYDLALKLRGHYKPAECPHDMWQESIHRFATLIRQHVAAEVARETAELRKAHQIQQKNYITLYEAVVGSGTFAGTPDAFEVVKELRKDSERLSWLQDHADEMEIRFFTSDALHYYAQEFMNGKHTILRWCIDQAMKSTARKSSPPPPAS